MLKEHTILRGIQPNDESDHPRQGQQQTPARLELGLFFRKCFIESVIE